MSSNSEYSIEEIKELIKQYVKHIASGYSKESFKECDYRTIERHLSVYSTDLQSEKKELDKAYRACRHYWETIGIKMARSNEGNATAWIFNMKNRYPDEWSDKTKTELSGDVGVRKFNWFEDEYEKKTV